MNDMKIDYAINFSQYFIVLRNGMKNKLNRIECCNLVIATITTNYSAINFTTILHGNDLEGKELCIKVRITIDVKNFFNVVVAHEGL